MATYYVSGQNGSDSNNGKTPALAKKTIVAGLGACTSAGDILIIGPGTYREVLNSSDFAGMNGSAPGNEGKVLGDPDASNFPDDTPGPVRVTKKDILPTTLGKSSSGIWPDSLTVSNMQIALDKAKAISCTGVAPASWRW